MLRVAQVFVKFKPDPQFVDLICKLLVYAPKERLKPVEALLHPFFDELRKEPLSLPNV